MRAFIILIMVLLTFQMCYMTYGYINYDQHNLYRNQRKLLTIVDPKHTKSHSTEECEDDPTPVPTPTKSPSVTPTMTPKPSVTPTMTPKPSVTPTMTPKPSVIPTISPKPSVTPVPCGELFKLVDCVPYQSKAIM